MKKQSKPCLIYNLFPRLVGTIDQWMSHIERAKSMGFDWIFINSFYFPGFSGSLYAVKDYYRINPLFLNSAITQPPMEQLRVLLDTMDSINMCAMMDLVINHTAIDSVLVHKHPEWYKRNTDGSLKNPGAREGNKTVVWGDLATIDNANSRDRNGLWNYWLDLCLYYLDLGFNGFRCDAAYQVPEELWKFLISNCKKKYPRAFFFAESLGCKPRDTIRLAEAGFDYIFNSSKWWDFQAPWCLEQYRMFAPYASSISFPESHDTERLMTELNGDITAVISRYLFSALFSTGIMMPVGFEYGFKKRMNVVETQGGDWEEASANLVDFIREANRIKMKYKIFQEDNSIDIIPVNNKDIACIKKTSLAKDEEALFLINKSLGQKIELGLPDITQYFSDKGLPEDLSLERPARELKTSVALAFSPGEIKLFYRKVKSL